MHEMVKLLPRVMALTSKMKDVTVDGIEGPEAVAAALVKVGDGAARALLMAGKIEGEQFYIFAVGGENSSRLLAGLSPTVQNV